MRRPILVRSAVITAAAALLVAGCGGGAATTSTKDPKAAFSTGLSGLADTDVLTVTLKFDTTADKLMGFAKESGDTLDATTAKEIASGEIIFESKTLDGKKLSQLKAGQKSDTAQSFLFKVNGTTYAEIRSRENVLYAKADVKGLLDLFGQSKMYAELQARTASMPAFVKAAVAGQWISIDLDTVKALIKQFGGAAVPSPNPAEVQKFMTDLEAAIQKNVDVTRVGTDDQGDHLKLNAHTRPLLTDLLRAFGSVVPGAGAALSKIDPSQVPDNTLVLDAWINDGALAKLSLDFVQFAKPGEAKPGDSLPAVLSFDRSGDDISKPDGATPIDLSQLGALLGGLGG